MKKKYVHALGLWMGLAIANHGIAQNVGVNATGATPNASTILDLNTGNTFTSPNGKGLLIPNVALTGTGDATTVTSPATSLMVYNTATAGAGATAVTPGYYYWDGTKWVQFQSSSNASQDWKLTGNAGTTAGTNFIGTTDAVDFVTKTNNAERMRVMSSGNVGIGTTTPATVAIGSVAAKLTVSGGDASLNNVTVGKGAGTNTQNLAVGEKALFSNTSSNSNTALGFQALYANTTGSGNTAIGSAAMSNNTTGQDNQIIGNVGMLVNNGNYNVGIGTNVLRYMTSGNSNTMMGYKAGFNQTSGDNNIALGANTDVPSLTGSNQMNIGNLIYGTGMTGSGAGNIGIGTTTPTNKLTVNTGTVNGAIKIVDGTQGTGKVLTSDANGVGTWTTPASIKPTVIGTFPGSPTTVTSSTASMVYTGVYIDLTPGKWILLAGLMLDNSSASNEWGGFQFSTSNTSVSNTGFSYLLPLAGHAIRAQVLGTGVNSWRPFNMVSGSQPIDVTTNVRIYLMLDIFSSATVSFGTSSYENYLYAVPIN